MRIDEKAYRNGVNLLKTMLVNLRITIICISCLNNVAQAATQVFTTNDAEGPPLGLYLEVEYLDYPEPIEIDFKSRQSGNDWRAILTNYYHSIYTQDKNAYVDLHSDKDGGRERAAESVDEFLTFRPNVKLTKVELNGMFQVGKLIFPLVKREITPKSTGPVPIIVCDGQDCFKTIRQGRQYINALYSSLEGRYAKYLRKLSAAEREEFGLVKDNLQRYQIIPVNPVHKAPENQALYPTIYLNLQSYPRELRVPLVLSQERERTTSIEEFMPVEKFLRELKRLDSSQVQDNDTLNSIFIKAFQDEKTQYARIPLFFLRDYGFENTEAELWRYTEVVRRWSAIIPVGYLVHGDIRFVYFIPETSDYPVDKKGRGIVQMLPVSVTDGTYGLSFEGLPYTALSSLQFPEAIELAMQFFYSDSPGTVADQRTGTADVDSPDQDQKEIESPADSDQQKAVFIILLLVMAAVLGYWIYSTRKRSRGV